MTNWHEHGMRDEHSIRRRSAGGGWRCVTTAATQPAQRQRAWRIQGWIELEHEQQGRPRFREDPVCCSKPIRSAQEAL